MIPHVWRSQFLVLFIGGVLSACDYDPAALGPNTESAPSALSVTRAATPQAEIADIIDAVETLVAQGQLSRDQGDGLIDKLKEAILKLDDGNDAPAVNQLRAFINQVNGFVNAGVLSSADGEFLIGAAGDVIDRINGTVIVIVIDATALSGGLIAIGSIGNFPSNTLQGFQLEPATYDLAQVGRVQFTVGVDGTVDFDPAFDGILDGRGTSTLVVNGLPITIDATGLASAEFTIAGIGSFPTAAPADLQVLPTAEALYGFVSPQLSFEFAVRSDGSVDFDSSLDAVVSGRGTSMLTVSP